MSTVKLIVSDEEHSNSTCAIGLRGTGAVRNARQRVEHPLAAWSGTALPEARRQHKPRGAGHDCAGGQVVRILRFAGLLVRPRKP